MMAVIVIIVLLAGLTTPIFFRTWRAEMLRSEARVLMGTVQTARYNAVVRQHPMILNFDFDGQAYWVEASTQTETNLTMQIFSASTNSLAIGSGAASLTAPQAEDFSTNAAVAALPQSTRRELSSDVRLAQLQGLDQTATANGTATMTCYPNGSCEGGLIILTGANGDALGVSVDPLTTLPKLIQDVQAR